MGLDIVDGDLDEFSVAQDVDVRGDGLQRHRAFGVVDPEGCADQVVLRLVHQIEGGAAIVQQLVDDQPCLVAPQGCVTVTVGFGARGAAPRGRRIGVLRARFATDVNHREQGAPFDADPLFRCLPQCLRGTDSRN